MIGSLESSSSGSGSPSWRDGQKWRSIESACAWNVRAVTPGRPSARSRATISPAAFSVNVTTSTWSGGTTSVPIAYAVRRLITRVLPGPGAGEDRDRAARREDGLALLGVEVVEEAFGLESGHVPRLAAVAHPRLDAAAVLFRRVRVPARLVPARLGPVLPPRPARPARPRPARLIVPARPGTPGPRS